MICDGEVMMDFDGGAVTFYDKYHAGITLNQGCTLVTHRFVSTIGVTKRGAHQGHNVDIHGRLKWRDLVIFCQVIVHM